MSVHQVVARIDGVAWWDAANKWTSDDGPEVQALMRKARANAREKAGAVGFNPPGYQTIYQRLNKLEARGIITREVKTETTDRGRKGSWAWRVRDDSDTTPRTHYPCAGCNGPRPAGSPNTRFCEHCHGMRERNLPSAEDLKRAFDASTNGLKIELVVLDDNPIPDGNRKIVMTTPRGTVTHELFRFDTFERKLDHMLDAIGGEGEPPF